MERKKRPGYLTQYAKHARISKQAAATQLTRVGIDYLHPFDFAEADRRRQAARSADRMPFAKPIYSDVPADKPAEAGDKEEALVYAEHQAKREYYKAELSRLEFEERIGKLIEADKVAAEWFRIAKLVHDAVMNVPPRVAGVIASESDERKVHDLLEKELRQSLEALAMENQQAA